MNNLWVRSQDKRILIKVDNLYLNANYENKRIYTIDINDEEINLGEYAAKERALEVLDEIQKTIETHILGQTSTEWDTWYKGTVYEMPIS